MAEGAPVGRRMVLSMLGLGALGVVAGGPLSSLVSAASEAVRRGDPTGLSDLLPGGWRFYSVTDVEPVRSRASWTLAVTGLVTHPVTLRFADLARLPQTSLTSDFQCVTGWRIPRVRWVGVRLSDLLDSVGVRGNAAAVSFGSFDGTYTESLTLAQARRPDVLLAHTLDGGPLSRDHGGPVRLLVAPMYGYKSCKWLGSVRVVDRVEGGYWEQFGYAQNAWVGRSNGRSDAPTGASA